MKILLAIDDSKFSESALRMVISQNRPQETEVRVVHVTEPIAFHFQPPAPAEYYVPTPELENVRKENLRNAQGLVGRGVEKLRVAGFRADSAVLEGDARAEIIDLAERWSADLIVVGSHGHRGINRFLIGSVSEYVARHAPCSVEIVRLPAGS